MTVRYQDVGDHVVRRAREIGGCELVSFDVFDTLIRRRCTRAAVHDRVLSEMVAILLDLGVRPSADVRAARALAIQQLCAEAGDRGLDPEFHIDGLYELVLERCTGDLLAAEIRAAIAARLVEFELDCERRALLPIAGMRAQLDRIRAVTPRLVFVSDMYLGAGNVQALLDHCDFGDLFDAGYVSGDTGRYKATGRAFEHLVEQEHVDPARTIHVGDHEIADDAAPRRLGIETVRIVDPALDRSRLRERIDHPFGVAGSAVALQAWTQAIEPESEPFAARYGRTVLGPAFAAFVHQVLEAALADGVDALYFLSRDGFVPQCIYDVAARSLRYRGHAPPARYLVVSRLPTVRAIMVGGFSIKALMSARNQLVPTERTVRNTLRSLGISNEIIGAVCTDHVVDPDRSFDDAYLQHPALLSALNDARLMEAAHESGRVAHELLIDYLEQEGVLDHQRVGIVDIGWGGTIQDQLGDALQHLDDPPRVIGYYFGGNRSLFDRRTPRHRMSPLVSSVYSASGQMFLGNTATFAAVGLLEEAARASHGTCTGYRRSGACVEPILKPDEERPAELAGEEDLHVLQAGIVAHAEPFFDGVDFLHVSTTASKALAHHALQRMVYAPTLDEIEFWRALTHTNDIGGLFQIDEQFLPAREPWWRRPADWRSKTRASMWTQGSVRYLLGAPGLLAYTPAWALSYARKVQRDLNVASIGVPLDQPRLRRRRPDRPGTTIDRGQTLTTRLYDSSLERLHGAGEPRIASNGISDDHELYSALQCMLTTATALAARFAPGRLSADVRIVNDGLPVGLVARRSIALRMSPLIARTETSARRELRMVSKVLRRALRC
jgi:FMN phosphatase YigB (HAD superfamily)